MTFEFVNLIIMFNKVFILKNLFDPTLIIPLKFFFLNIKIILIKSNMYINSFFSVPFP